MSSFYKTLNLIILPTEKCNFRCTYCYEDFAIGRMQPVVVQGIKRLILRRIQSGTIEALYISWFGSEPLVATSVVMDISSFAARLEHDGKLESFSGGVTTNAYRLDIATLQNLVNSHLKSYQVTLDGYGDDHDRTRKRADGRGTFAVIWANLLNAEAWRGGDFTVTLRLHITQESFANLPRLCREIAAAFGGDGRFRVLFKRVVNLGGSKGPNIRVVGADDAQVAVDRAKRYLADASVTFNEGLLGSACGSGADDRVLRPGGSTKTGVRVCALAEKLGSAQHICYAALPNSFVIRANGRIAKCTVALSHPMNDVGFIDPEGRLHIESGKAGFWTRGLSSGDHGELACPASGLSRRSAA